jgi:hypothetical protein
MLANITNQTLPVVAEQIEAVLDNYPHHPYQQAFATPHLRQKLLAYVLSQVPAHYQVIEDAQEQVCPDYFSENYPTTERLCIEALIRRGIQQILHEHADWASRHIPEEISPTEAPSHWFG